MMGNKRRAVASGGAHSLPEEMMTEVFLRLPVKSILRFRAVCRSWNAVLSSEEFCCLHMAKVGSKSAPPNLFFTSQTAGFDATAVYSSSSSGPDDGLLFTLDGVRGGDFIHMTPAPCRGLTLLHDPFAPAYYVFNASTRAVTRLPPCHNALCVTAGLGFDARRKKYKVVRLFLGDFGDKQHIKCETYTLGGDHGDYWKPPAAGVPFRFCRAAQATISHARHNKVLPVFANGFLHWLIPPSFVVERPRAAILSFSVTDEIFSWVQSPPFEVSGVHLVELAGHLCMVRDLRHVGMLETWKLNGYGSGGWSLEHRIDLLQHISRHDVIEPEIVRVIGSVGSCGSTKRIVIATSKCKVIIYDPVSHTVETATAIRETHSSYQAEKLALSSVSLFQESLVPVHQTNKERALSVPLAKATREILLRLPADCTMRCKLVSKQWLSLIEDNSFMRSSLT
ncbi:F-box protein At3g07870-like [Panicum virgatum]|uniref:F-box protein At3g07870-like n=1 Tax=Panicum virgatum TaxID=38727 RepID=UPI0019D537A5|nr:F-box protein At3g07870-like [Panicum virgatum]